MIFIGIDPGLQGALVAINENYTVLGKFKAPILKNEKGKNLYDVPQMVEILKQFNPNLVVLEKSQAMPGQGVSSMWAIGRGYGLWEGIIAALGYPYKLVHPKTWQKEILKDYDKSDTKQASTLYAGRTFPNESFKATDRCTKIDNNITDAVCMAVYAKQTY